MPAVSLLKAPFNAYLEIAEKFLDNASFLWVLRSIAVHQPHYNLDDIRHLDQRIQAQIDGLMSAIEPGWRACQASLDYQQAGEVFVAAVIAFDSGDASKIQQVTEAGLGSPETLRGLISALGWVNSGAVNGWISRFLDSKDMNHKYLAISACSVRRSDPGENLVGILERDDCRQHSSLYARALRLAGELKRRDLNRHLQLAMQSDNDAVRFWSCWSASLLGGCQAVSQLKQFVLQPGPYQERAIELCFRRLPVEEARRWITELGAIDGQVRAVIRASSVLGDPHAVDWLISRMEQPVVSRVAGEAFSQISGIDIAQFGLAIESVPEGDEIQDDSFVMEDENLPWPNTAGIKAIWANHRSAFVSGQRYFLGKPITADVLRSSLLTANQRRRKAAALELALINAESPLINAAAETRSW